MSERSDKIRELLHSPKSQETETTSENENIQEIENIEQPPQKQPEEPNEEEDFYLSGFEAINNTVSAKSNLQSGGGGIYIVNSSAKGKCKRIEISTAVMDYLGIKDSASEDDTVQFLIKGNRIVIGQNISAADTSYFIRRGQNGDKRGIIHNSALVLDLTKKFDLDFSDGHSCRSFSHVKFATNKGKKLWLSPLANY